jgi:predicted ATPase
MKIESVRIRNFRAFEDETIPLNDYACLVGPNGAGKSTVLYALNVFFRSTRDSVTDLTRLHVEDFHNKNTSEPISITVTFVDLNQDAQSDFSHYFRQGKLVVSAVAKFDPAIGSAEVKQFGERLGMPAFAQFFKARDEGGLATELKAVYSDLRSQFPGLPNETVKQKMADSLNAYESANGDKCSPLQSEDQFYGWTKGENRLRKYVQWIYVPAVKDAATEQSESRDTFLGDLLARTVRAKLNFEPEIETIREQAQRDYKKLLHDHEGELQQISKSLAQRIAEWAHPDASLRLEWQQELEKVIRVDQPYARVVAGELGFEGELVRFGHGFQRCYLLALLQELAGSDAPGAPRLLLGCEEPELYQYPPQARHLAGILKKLSLGNSQVLLCTHSPLFVSGERFEDVRLFRRSSGAKASVVSRVDYAQIAKAVADATGEPINQPSGTLAKVHQALQPSLNEMFFTSRLILVEGLEDLAYITSYLNLMGKWDEYRRHGCHLVPTNGKSEMIPALVIAQHMKIPVFVVFDGDTDKQTDDAKRARHRRDNSALLRLCGVATPDPAPLQTCWGKNVVMWPADIGDVVKAEIGADNWVSYGVRADQRYGLVGGLQKNSLHIGARLSFAWDDSKRAASLERLCNEILTFAETDGLIH